MFEKRVFTESEFPPVESEFWKDKAEELWDQYKYYEEASLDLRENIWPECARAYRCKFTLPENEGMDWATDSDLHETDIWDAVNYHSDAILGSVMPRDDSYFEMLSRVPEEQGVTNDVRDLLKSLCRKGNVRGQYGKHIRQLLVYGTSALWVRWEDIETWCGYGPTETARRLELEGIVLTPEELMRRYKKIKFPKMTFSGPVVRTIDMHDLFLDPGADLGADRVPPVVVRFYMTLEDLKAATDEDGKPKFGNLDKIQPQTFESIMSTQAGQRLELMYDLGLSPAGRESAMGGRLVPVYLFHQPIRKFNDGSEYIDTFFYVAESQQQRHVIRAEPNPHPNGNRGIYIDTYVEHWGQTAYGTGAVLHSLKAWQEKCVMSALGLSAAMASVFPAYNMITGVVQEDREYKVAPGSINLVNHRNGIGLDFIAPIPAPASNVQLGQSVEQWYGQKILGQFGSLAQIATQDPTKSIKASKTATQANIESTTGSVMRDNIIEKLSIGSLEPLLQDTFDLARVNLKDFTFEKTQDGATAYASVTPEQFDQDRKVLVTGYHGLINKAREIEELQNALSILTTGNAMQMIPTLAPVLQETIFRLLGRLGIKNLEKYKQDPILLLMQNPQIQAQFMQLAAQAAQNPQLLQQLMLAGQPQPQGPAPGANPPANASPAPGPTQPAANPETLAS